MVTERIYNNINCLFYCMYSDLISDIIIYIPMKRFHLKAPTICRGYIAAYSYRYETNVMVYVIQNSVLVVDER